MSSFFYYAGAHRVVNVMVYVCNAVAPRHDVAFQRLRVAAAGVVEYSVAHFKSKIHALAVVFEIIYHAQRLLVVRKMRKLRKRPLSRMAVGRMSQIVRKTYCLRQVLVKP